MKHGGRNAPTSTENGDEAITKSNMKNGKQPKPRIADKKTA
jgi:hypothetical protein